MTAPGNSVISRMNLGQEDRMKDEDTLIDAHSALAHVLTKMDDFRSLKLNGILIGILAERDREERERKKKINL